MTPKTKQCINPVGRPRTVVPVDRVLLRKLRLEKGLKQADIAKAIGCCESRISQFEIGYKGGIPMELLKHIAIILEVDYLDLMVEEVPTD